MDSRSICIVEPMGLANRLDEGVCVREREPDYYFSHLGLP